MGSGGYLLPLVYNLISFQSIAISHLIIQNQNNPYHTHFLPLSHLPHWFIELQCLSLIRFLRFHSRLQDASLKLHLVTHSLLHPPHLLHRTNATNIHHLRQHSHHNHHRPNPTSFRPILPHSTTRHRDPPRLSRHNGKRHPRRNPNRPRHP